MVNTQVTLIVAAIIALAIGAGGGYYIGYDKGWEQALIEHEKEEASVAEETENPLAEVKTNPLEDVKTNPFKEVKTNPFE